MFTLQILDRGQTFLHPLDDRPVTIGSGPDAGLRLGEAQVAPAHARLEPHGESVRLVALAPTRVNGTAVETADLQLGDRVEIGRAVLVVGRSVARSAGPEDVLADVRPRTARPRQRHTGRWLALAGGALLLGAAVWLAVQGNDEGSRVRAGLAEVRRRIDKGEIDRAAATLASLRDKWQAATDDRLERLAVEQQRLDELRAAVASTTAEVLDPAIERSYAQWILELQRREAEAEPAQRVAARIVRSSLHGTLERRPRKAVPAVPGPEAPGPAPVAQPLPAPPAEPADPVADAIADAERHAGQGLFAQAIAGLSAELGEARDAAAVARLQAGLAAVRRDAAAALQALLAEAARATAADRPRDAVTLLVGARHRFPDGAEFQPLVALLRETEAAIAAAEEKQRLAKLRPGAAPVAAAVDETMRRATLATLRAQLDKIRAAEEAGAFADAAALLREGATLVADRDADFAARLAARAAEADLLGAWHELVAAALRAGRPLETTLRTGRPTTLQATEGPVLVGSNADGAVRAAWNDLAPSGVMALAEQVHATGPAALGAATLLYKGGDTALAETLLGRLVRADARCKEAAGPVIARGRGEPFDPRGYELGKDGFVAVKAIEAQKLGQQLAARLGPLLRGKDVRARDRFVADVLAQGPDVLPALAAALQRELGQQIERLEAGALKKQVDRLAAQRGELDRLRAHARDLIYDEVTYFYPYKPPAVSSEKFAEYNRVQAEVNRRVDALRRTWGDDRLRIKVPASLQDDLARLDWVAGALADLGELDAVRLQQVEWARALPAGDSVGLADFCYTAAERAELEEWRAILAFDDIVQRGVPAGAREQLRITNEYRLMFRHRPLALSPQMCSASQGHAEEMSRLGYFSHTSPTPGRRTPFDRMKLAGYPFGASENIALHDSAEGAHVAWCHSSGHHRNLLNSNHREFGIGVDGRYWVQNFGSGATYEKHAAWNPAPPRRSARQK